MKQKLLASQLGCCCLALPVHAQQYSIDWHTIDGGGGTSTGGVYTVTGTIGQPDAGGPMTNGQFSVTGGFWASPQVIQTIGTYPHDCTCVSGQRPHFMDTECAWLCAAGSVATPFA